jgi:hypothetical protein
LSIELDYTEILCTDDENNEGYFFNSNVGGYIEPWIRGSNRFKLNITQFKIIEPANQQQSDLTIGQIRTNIDGIPSGRFLIQYNNNYKINDITI